MRSQVALQLGALTVDVATEAEADVIHGLVFARPHPRLRQLSRDTVRELVRNREFFFAEVDGLLVGSCYLHRVETGTWELGGLYTHPGFRQRGTAETIMVAILTEHRRWHRRATVIAYVLQTNTQAQRLFTRLGFTVARHDLAFEKDSLPGLSHMAEDDLKHVDIWQKCWGGWERSTPDGA